MPEQENRPQDVSEQPQNPEQFQAAREAAEQSPEQLQAAREAAEQSPEQAQAARETAEQSPEQLQAARETAEHKIDQAIDQYASKIPGGEQFASQAKEAAAGVLNTLEREAEHRFGGIMSSAGGFLGGLFGKRKKEEPPPS